MDVLASARNNEGMEVIFLSLIPSLQESGWHGLFMSVVYSCVCVNIS